MEQGAVKRVGAGRVRVRPQRVAADKTYTGRRIRTYLTSVRDKSLRIFRLEASSFFGGLAPRTPHWGAPHAVGPPC
jgi:hypothetical protein